MTGFAQAGFEFEDYNVQIQFKSLNHRYLDFIFKGTGITPASEKLLRNILKERVFRGKIEVTFDIFEYDIKNWNIHLNEELLAKIVEKIMAVKKKFGDDVKLSLDPLLKIPMIFHLDSALGDRFEAKNIDEMKKIIQNVVADFIESRAIEGKEIAEGLLAAIKKIESDLQTVNKYARNVEDEIYKKYVQKISRFVSEFEIDERRIAQEAAILAEKNCIVEEIDRIKIHIKRLKKLINDEKEMSKGKEADFLAQEIQREIHTIASKASSMEIQKHILKIRREMEKIKQQVQNVE